MSIGGARRAFAAAARSATAGVVLAVAVVASGGCASPKSLTPGTAAADVLARFGRPSATYVDVDGAARRLEYAHLGPFQQETYMVDLGADDRVLRVAQVLSVEQFARIRPGVDDTKTIRHEFGTPLRKQSYRLSQLDVWMYPYREYGVWNSEMGIFFDHDGVVRRLESGPDPRLEAKGDRDRR